MFIDLDNIEEREPVPGFRGRFVHTENMTIAYWSVQAGAKLPEHSHTQEQTATVIEGEFRLTIDGESRVLKTGTVALIPANVSHSGEAISDCRLIDTFYPVREDFR